VKPEPPIGSTTPDPDWKALNLETETIGPDDVGPGRLGDDRSRVGNSGNYWRLIVVLFHQDLEPTDGFPAVATARNPTEFRVSSAGDRDLGEDFSSVGVADHFVYDPPTRICTGLSWT
jgi:hypothetical protein